MTCCSGQTALEFNGFLYFVICHFSEPRRVNFQALQVHIEWQQAPIAEDVVERTILHHHNDHVLYWAQIRHNSLFIVIAWKHIRTGLHKLIRTEKPNLSKNL